MRARPGFDDAPDRGLGITIAKRHPLGYLLLQFDNEPRERLGRSGAGYESEPRTHSTAMAQTI